MNQRLRTVCLFAGSSRRRTAHTNVYKKYSIMYCCWWSRLTKTVEYDLYSCIETVYAGTETSLTTTKITKNDAVSLLPQLGTVFSLFWGRLNMQDMDRHKQNACLLHVYYSVPQIPILHFTAFNLVVPHFAISYFQQPLPLVAFLLYTSINSDIHV